MKVEDLAHGPRPDLVVAQMEIRKEVVQQMIETAGKAGIDFLLNAAPADPITKRTYRYIMHLLVNESEAAIMSGRDLKEVNQDTWPKIAQEFLTPASLVPGTAGSSPPPQLAYPGLCRGSSNC